jgi:hypothetical protein
MKTSAPLQNIALIDFERRFNVEFPDASGMAWGCVTATFEDGFNQLR